MGGLSSHVALTASSFAPAFAPNHDLSSFPPSSQQSAQGTHAPCSPVITPGHAAMLNGHLAHEEHSQGTAVHGQHHGQHTSNGSASIDEKVHEQRMESV